MKQESLVFRHGERQDIEVLDKIIVKIKAMFPLSGKWMYDEGYEKEHTVCEVLSDVWHPVHMTIHEPVWPRSTKECTEAEVKEIMNETSEKVYNTIKETLDKGN